MFWGINLPPKTNKRYYPRIRTICNHIFLRDKNWKSHWLTKKRYKKKWMNGNEKIQQPVFNSDQNTVVVCRNTDENSECETNVKWKSKSSQNSLLFVYHEPWQKRLLLRYGNELVLLDATYGTKRYALPLLLLVVKINIDYQIVGAFVSEND